MADKSHRRPRRVPLFEIRPDLGRPSLRPAVQSFTRNCAIETLAKTGTRPQRKCRRLTNRTWRSSRIIGLKMDAADVLPDFWGLSKFIRARRVASSRTAPASRNHKKISRGIERGRIGRSSAGWIHQILCPNIRVLGREISAPRRLIQPVTAAESAQLGRDSG